MAYRDPFVLPLTSEQKAKAERAKQVCAMYAYTCVHRINTTNHPHNATLTPNATHQSKP
jgi:hypothetical protein